MKWLLLFILCLTGIGYGDYVQLARNARDEFCTKMRKEKNVLLIGTGGDLSDNVKNIFVHFISFNQLTIEQSRQLYVELVEVFLKRVNEDEQLRPHLHNYPFTVKNFDLTLSFREKDSEVRKEFIALVSHKKESDVIFYAIYDNETKKFIDIYQEPYDEARQIVQKDGCLDRISYLELQK